MIKKRITTSLLILLISSSFLFSQTLPPEVDENLLGDIPLSEEEINDKDYYTIQHDEFFGNPSNNTDDDFFGGSNNNDDDLFGGSSSDDELFGGPTSDDELFSSSDEDDLFSGDELIEEIDTTKESDLGKGILFEAGSVKIGGRFKTGVNTNTVLYSPKQNDFGKNLKNTTFTPDLSAFLTIDARPNNNLRMYTKFGFGYPFKSSVSLNLNQHDLAILQELGNDLDRVDQNNPLTVLAVLKKYGEKLKGVGPEAIMAIGDKFSISDWLTVKELFTDFNIKERAFFRFGIHTVSWGTGYFFSPVSDIINTSSIDPENPTEQVNGSLNLRTQIIFPNTTNCLWAYVIPSNDFSNGQSAQSYLRDTAIAAKYDLLVGDWELGFGGFYKYENAPKLTFTANGSIEKLSLFGEVVYQYGSNTQWNEDKNWKGKKSIIHATMGGMYSWKTPGISLSLQYYFDGNDKDFKNRIMTNGHNIALAAGFTKFGKVEDLSASLFVMANFGKKGFTEAEKKGIEQGAGFVPELPVLMMNAFFFYSPSDYLKFSAGPTMSFTSYKEKPTVSFEIGATLGGGKF